MALGADRYGSRADTLVFIGCVLLSVAAMSLPGRLRDPLTQALRQTVLAPFLSLQQQIERLSASLARDRKSTRLNSSHLVISYAVFCLKKKNHSTASVHIHCHLYCPVSLPSL